MFSRNSIAFSAALEEVLDSLGFEISALRFLFQL